MPCGYLGRIVARRESFTIHQCTCDQVARTCVELADTLKLMPGSEAAACDQCEFFTDGPELPDDLKYLACRERGKTTGDKIHCQCGVDRTIYQCGIKSRCLKKLPIGRSKESFNGQLDEVQICSECDSVRI